jgi:hypothetical protein
MIWKNKLIKPLFKSQIQPELLTNRKTPKKKKVIKPYTKYTQHLASLRSGSCGIFEV